MQIDTLQNKLGRGDLCATLYLKLQIGGRQSLCGGCRFTFWRVPIYISEAEIVLGVLYRNGGKPKKVGTIGSRDMLALVLLVFPLLTAHACDFALQPLVT